jgi:hypothetical protein
MCVDLLEAGTCGIGEVEGPSPAQRELAVPLEDRNYIQK